MIKLYIRYKTYYPCNVLLLTGFIFILSSFSSKAQLSVNTSLSPAQLVQNILIGGGVTVSNVTYSGATGSIGRFATGSTNTNLGISNGIIISSGKVDGNPSQPYPPIGSHATNFASTPNGTGSDSQLAALSGSSIFDAAILEFDFIPQSDTVSFRYVFGSEEYPEFVNQFNDVFGFFISGPNPSGGSYSNKNIALIPQTNTPISINTVNNGSNNTGPCVNCTYYINNSNGNSIVYDGFTKVMTALCKVVPCVSYHIKIAIGDAGDDIYDSGVFLEANSFTSNTVTVNTIYTNSVDTTAIEGCSEAVVRFDLSRKATSPYTINYSISGSAQQGTDYTPIPSSVVIPVGSSTATIKITPVNDGIAEGIETVILNVQTSLCGSNHKETIYIRDNTKLSANARGDTSIICGGNANIQIHATGGIQPYSYVWNHNAGNTLIVSVSPNANRKYIATVTDACGIKTTDSVLVKVTGIKVSAGQDTTICPAGVATLVGSGGSSYLWSNNVNTKVNKVSPMTTTIYYLTVSTSTCDGYDTVTVFTFTPPDVRASATFDSLCVGESTTLSATGGVSYLWSSSPSDPSLSGQETYTSVTVTPGSTTTYILEGRDNNTCVTIDSILIYQKPTPIADFKISPPHICIHETVIVTFSGSASSRATFSWDFGNAEIISGTGRGSYLVRWANKGNQTIKLSVDDLSCLSNIKSKSVLVSPVPVAEFTANNISGCIPLEVNFINNSYDIDSATIYTWIFGDGNSSNQMNPDYIYRLHGLYDVMLIVTNGSACQDTMKINALVNAHPKPYADMYLSPKSVSIYDPVVYFYDKSEGYPEPVEWLWTLGDGTNSTVPDFVHTFADTGTYYVDLAVKNKYGCVDSTRSYVFVNPDNTIYVPKSFTPNYDEKNDIFYVYGENLRDFNIQIFNRWGNLVFESNDISRGWDGKYNNTESLQATYVWVVNYTDAHNKRKSVTGHVTLIR